MEEGADIEKNLPNVGRIVFGKEFIFSSIVIAAILVTLKTYNFLLFHTVAELFSVFVAITTCIVAWQMFPFTKNHYLMYLGAGYFGIGVLDFMHTLAYKGMGPLNLEVANPAIQIWIATRYAEALLLLTAPLFLTRPVARYRIFSIFGLIAIALSIIVLTGYFPTCYIEGVGLTAFKVYSEYLIIVILLLAILHLVKKKELIDGRILRLIILSISFTILAEFAFTLYVDVYGLSNFIGHMAKYFSYSLIFLAVVRITLAEPFLAMSRGATTYDAIPDIAIVVDNEGIIRQVNSQTLKSTGITEAELLGADSHQLFHAESVEKDDCLVCKSIEGGVSLSQLELELPEKGRWLNISLSPIIVEAESRGMVQVIRDVTEHKLMEEELRDSENRFFSLFELSPSATLLADGKGFFGCNKAAYKLLGCNNKNEVIGTSIEDWSPSQRPNGDFSKDDIEKFKKIAFESDETYLEWDFIRYDGSEFAGAIMITPIDWGGNKALQYIIQDITKRKREEETRRWHQVMLMKLVKLDYSETDKVLEKVTEVNSTALNIERVSIWFLNESGSEMSCENAFIRSSGKDGKGMILKKEDYQSYFDAIYADRILAANDAMEDPRTSEFAENYLTPLGITSMLDVGIWISGRLVGVICHEHTGSKREWSVEEQEFAVSTADLISIAMESAERKKAELALIKSSRALRTLGESVQLLLTANSEKELLDDICRIITDTGGYKMAWIGFSEPDGGKDILPVASSGFEDRYFEKAGLNMGNGPIGTAIRDNIPFCIHDVDTDPSFTQWRGEAKELGYLSVLSLPLGNHGVALGGLSIYSKYSDAFNEEEIALLQKLTDNLSYGIFAIRAKEEGRLAAAALNISEEKFRSAFERAAIGMALADLEGNFIQVNPVLCRMMGYSKDELLNRSFRNITHPDDLNSDISNVRKLLDGKADSFENIEKRYIHKSGAIVWGLLSVSLLRDADGNPQHLTAQVQDVTERKHAEERAEIHNRQLLQADKMKSLGTMVAGVAHEINNPNNFIMINSQTIAEVFESLSPLMEEYYGKGDDKVIGALSYKDLKEMVPKLLTGMLEGSQRIKRIVASLKDFSRQTVSGLKGDVDINMVVDSAVLLTSNLLKKSTSNFNVHKGKQLPVIHGSAQEIEQVLINLITNSCYALPDKSKSLSISTFVDHTLDSVVIKVVDEGVGISEDNLKRIMDPFFTTKRDSGGTGLGLSVSYNIIKEHGGSLEFVSDIGEKTEAIITLPFNKVGN